MGRLNYILHAKPQIDDRYARVPAGTPIAGSIEFRDLTFTYPTTIAGNGAKSNGAGQSAGPAQHHAERSGGLHAGDCRTHRQRQDDTGGIGRATLGST